MDNVKEPSAVSSERKARLAEQALENKYRESFGGCAVFGQKYGEYFYQVQAYPQNSPDLRFSAYVDLDGGGVKDTYVEKRVCSRISDQIMHNLDMLTGNYDVYVKGIGPQPSIDRPDIEVEEYIKLDSQNRFAIYIFYSHDGAEKVTVQKAIEHILKGLSVLPAGRIKFFVMNDCVLQEVQEYLDVNDDIYFDFQEIEDKMRGLDISFSLGNLNKTGEMIMSELGDILK